MKVSRTWLQTFFDSPLPPVAALDEASTFHAFEVEEVLSDDCIDLKVLPDRAGYALSHRGIASELSAILRIPFNDPFKTPVPALPPSTSLTVSVESKKCLRYMGAVIKGVQVGPSPEWLKAALESVGQRSINNVVDATNYVMLNIGQPLHAFDAAKSGYHITVREAVGDEQCTALGGAEYRVPQGALVIANATSVLGLAGIKGGVAAEITDATTDIIVESANFDGTAVRKTAQALKQFTDSSTRFQNRPSPELAAYGMRDVVALILDIAGGTLEGGVDVYPKKFAPYYVGVCAQDVTDRLGAVCSDPQLEDVFNRLALPFEKVADPVNAMCARAGECIGVPYVLGASVLYDAPRSFDCSSFTSWLAARSGITLPRVSVDQYVAGVPITKDALRAGDLVFANTGIGQMWYETHEYLRGTAVPEGVDHVGIYVGDGYIVHATGGDIMKVVKEKLVDAARFKNTVGYRRVVGSDAPRYVITVPFYRTDLRIKEDLVEEVGRIVGYETLEAKLLPVAHVAELSADDRKRYAIKDALVADGFTEVSTYVFQDVGDLEVMMPLAEDKKYLRPNLAHGHVRAAALNLQNAPLFGVSDIKLFELGATWPNGVETEVLAITFVGTTKGWEKRRDEYFAKFPNATRTGNTIEMNFATIPDVPAAPAASTAMHTFVPFSAYPFVLRDIALWTPTGTDLGMIYQTICAAAGPLLVRADLFDQFTKGDETSVAYHLVFQSLEKTLTDEEVNERMQAVYTAVAAKGWRVR